MANNVSDLLLHGDAGARLVQQVFVPDVTLARIRCNECGVVIGIGALTVYAGSMGAVLKCSDCDNVLMRVVDTPHGLWLEMSGARNVRFERPCRIEQSAQPSETNESAAGHGYATPHAVL
jgi:uncharacterized protein DUF6510